MRRLILATVLTLSGLGVAAPPTLAVGNIIHVTTTADGEFPGDGNCSLAAAIKASNTGAAAGYCSPGSADLDTIIFSLGTGSRVITLAADLPAITAPVTIDGGAGRVEVNGPGTLTTGFDIQAGATGTTIRDMIVDGFVTGIHVSGTAGTNLMGNIVGPNSDAGILVDGGNTDVTIGSDVDNTQGNSCADDCNLVKDNGRVGIEAHGGGTIEGNYVGTNAAGTLAHPSGIGMLIADGTWQIGGHTQGSRNLISGNTGDGLELVDCSCTVQGNEIGSTIDGNHQLGNGGHGIDLERPYTSLIGGPGYGTPNLISGNGGSGVYIDTDLRHDGATLTINGNQIGTTLSGQPLGNGGDGIHIGENAPATVVGTTILHTGNLIADNGGAGVLVTGVDQVGNRIQGNSIYKNTGKGIAVESGANGAIAPPTITGVSPLRGTACNSCTIDVYSDKADEGRVYQGTVGADASGNWTYSGTVYGPNATATSTDANHSTSEFSAPVVVSSGGGGGGGGGGAYQPDGRIALWTGAYVGNNLYNDNGASQTKSGKAKIGYIVEFNLSLQNDGDQADSFQLSVSDGSTTMYRLKFYRGSTDITAKVMAGTYTTPTMAKGGAVVITVDVIVKKEATAGSSVTRLVTITSVGDNAQLDALKFIVARK